MFIPGHLHLASASEVRPPFFRYPPALAVRRGGGGFFFFFFFLKKDGSTASLSRLTFELRYADVHFASRASRRSQRHGLRMPAGTDQRREIATLPTTLT
ncbi:hypothetical protein ACG3SK_00930 [Pseudomonas aeruginosa]